MKKCPLCAEEIQNEAIKCKHCGEMLEAKSSAINYKEVKKGIKQVESDRIAYNTKLFFVFIGAVFFGSAAGAAFGNVTGWIIGIIFFLFFGVKSARSYFELDKK